jgi:hypothetical protein
MAKKPGAIIFTVYYILKECGRLNEPFDAEFIIGEYQKMLNNEHQRSEIAEISSNFKKHHKKNEFITFQTVAKLRCWLRKHCGKKPATWFKEDNGNFTLIKNPDTEE